MAIKQTAGHDRLGRFAPQFAHLNDDVLFGQVWSREDELSARDRSMITCAGLMSMGLFPQLKSHMAMAKGNGVTRTEMVALITHLAFYAGWPKAWSAFDLAKEVYGENQDSAATPSKAGTEPDSGPYPLGDSADGPNFTGHVWLH
ncbi:MAG: carboxymuconolactone decarboxylase family protein, partial [Bifidobacteriales bacterium]|nr:carboxymuconolactone decarboxylase family protein [Bifidobacteriales bacterium]